MLAQIITENGQKKLKPLTADAGAGNPVGTIIVVCSNQIPSNYLPLGTQYNTSLYPVLYALLGTDTTPTASALGLPTLTSGQYAIKATSGLSENAQDNVINTLNEERSYSTDEINTGKKWIDGKPIYRKVVEINFSPNVTYTETVSADAGNSTYQVVNLSESVVVGSFGTRQPWYDSKSGNIPTTVYMSGGIVYFITEHSAGKANIVCEYTKTTD